MFENGNRAYTLGVVEDPAISITLEADREVGHLDEEAGKVEEQEVRVFRGDLAHKTVELVFPDPMERMKMKRRSA